MVDTERIRAALDRAGTLPPPPPPDRGTGRALAKEEELSALCRWGREESRNLRATLEQVLTASRRRQRVLRRERFLDRGDRLPPPPPPPRPRGLTSLVRRCWELLGELEREYHRLAELQTDRERQRQFRRLERSAETSRQTLTRIMEQRL